MAFVLTRDEQLLGTLFSPGECIIAALIHQGLSARPELPFADRHQPAIVVSTSRTVA